MERLTTPFNGGYLFNMPYIGDIKAQQEYIDKLSIKLGQYEDAEEQGLLLRLEYPNGWIPCEERLPVAETEVLILAKRKYRDGTFRYIITNAMYEDGTVSEYDSAWRWEDVDGEYDEENDCFIIPKGWWENKHYNPDGLLNYEVDDEVIAWQPLPKQYEEAEQKLAEMKEK